MISSSTTPRTLRRDIVFTFALALACYLAWLVRDVLFLMYVSALFAVALGPIVGFIGNIRIGRHKPFHSTAIFILLVLVIGGLTAFGFVAIPPVIHDLEEFGKEMPVRLPAIVDEIKRLPLANHVDISGLVAKAQDLAGNTATYLLTSIKNWANALFSIAMFLILMIYFTLEGDSAYHWALSFFPHAQRGRLDQALRRADVRMGKWLLGQGSLMLILGLTSTVVYLALHVRYAYALGVLTGLLNIIPVLGAAVCIVLALLAAAVDSWGRVIGVAIFYLIYIQIENSFLTPRIMKSSVDLPGLAIIVALLLGSALEGVMGALVSVPTAVLVAVLVDEYLVARDEDEPAASLTPPL